MPKSLISLFLATACLAGCGQSADPAMWQCQLSVQKENAGKSADAAEERGRSIEACMEAAGYRRESSRAACPAGSVDSSCYRR